MENSCLPQRPFDGLQAKSLLGNAFSLIQRDGKQDRFHRIVMALIRGRLCVGTNDAKQPVKMSLIFVAQRAAEFRPVRRGLFDQLPKCGNGAAHASFPSCPSGRHLARRFFAHQHQPAVCALGELAHLIRLCVQKLEKPLPRSPKGIRARKHRHRARQRLQPFQSALAVRSFAPFRDEAMNESDPQSSPVLSPGAHVVN
jgi:hypothetical protein